MSDLDMVTWSDTVERRLEKYTNKAEKTAFLVGLSLGARQMNDDERLRVCTDLQTLWEIDLSDDLDKPSGGRNGRVRKPAGLDKIDPALQAQLADFMAVE